MARHLGPDRRACGSTANGLIVGHGIGADARVSFAVFCRGGRRRKEQESTYFEHYYPWDERLPRLRQLPDGCLAHATELYSEDELRTSRVYNEWQRGVGNQNGLCMRLNGPDGSRIVWSFADPASDTIWQSAQLEMIERLVPHIRQFVRVRRVVAGAEALGASLGQLLDNTRVGVIHLDPRGRIVEANERARRLLRKGDGLFDEAEVLRARRDVDDAELQGLVASALPSFGHEGVGGSMSVRRPAGQARLAVHVNPVDARQMDFGLLQVAALVWVVDPESRSRIDPGMVTATLGLTQSESEVAAMLSEGKSVRDIARLTGRRENAVYKLLKQAYRRLGIARQAELVRLVLSVSEPPHLKA